VYVVEDSLSELRLERLQPEFRDHAGSRALPKVGADIHVREGLFEDATPAISRRFGIGFGCVAPPDED
jgi:hypothetical protein